MDPGRKLILGLLFLIQSVCGFADGCYFPARAVKTIPSIPTQRALLVWRDGVETLIVSSELDSYAHELVWEGTDRLCMFSEGRALSRPLTCPASVGNGRHGGRPSGISSA